MDDLSRFCCLNSRCPDFGRRGAGNLTVTGRLGKSHQYRLLYCRSCRARFSERKGTPLYRAHLPEDKVASILEHITEGCGVLQTARLVKVHPDTVSRYTRAAGDHARAAHDDLVARCPATREIQMDEAWSFVAKKEKNCDDDEPDDRLRGDCWDHVAFDPEHRLVVSVVPGERTAESVEELVRDVQERLAGRVPRLITTDEYSAYEGAILEAFGEEVVPPRTGRRGPTAESVQGGARGVELCHGAQDAEEGSGGGGGDAGDLRHRRDGRGGAGRFVGEPHGQHGVRRAAQRHGPQSQRAEGAEDVLLLEGLVDPSGGDLLQQVHLQLLLANEDAEGEGGRGSDAGHDGEAG